MSKNPFLIAIVFGLIGPTWLYEGMAGERHNRPSRRGAEKCRGDSGQNIHARAVPSSYAGSSLDGRGKRTCGLSAFQQAVADPNATVIFVGEGIKGHFCAEGQPDGGKSGFVHFHRLHAPEGEKGEGAHGHGGNKTEEGYWLKHIAVGEFEMMGTHFTPGTAMNFMPTPAPKC